MKNYTLSTEKITELENIHRTLRDRRQADRVKAVIALSKGWSASQIAEILLFDQKTARKYFERYLLGGTNRKSPARIKAPDVCVLSLVPLLSFAHFFSFNARAHHSSIF